MNFLVKVCADHETWPNCFGKFGVGKMNEKDQRRMEFLTETIFAPRKVFV